MTYFTLFSLILLGFAMLIFMVRMSVLEEHLERLQHEVLQVRIQSEKKGRLHAPTHIELWRNVRDYADGEGGYYD